LRVALTGNFARIICNTDLFHNYNRRRLRCDLFWPIKMFSIVRFISVLVH